MTRIVTVISLLVSSRCLAAPLSAGEGGVATVNRRGHRPGGFRPAVEALPAAAGHPRRPLRQVGQGEPVQEGPDGQAHRLRAAFPGGRQEGDGPDRRPGGRSSPRSGGASPTPRSSRRRSPPRGGPKRSCAPRSAAPWGCRRSCRRDRRQGRHRRRRHQEFYAGNQEAFNTRRWSRPGTSSSPRTPAPLAAADAAGPDRPRGRRGHPGRRHQEGRGAAAAAKAAARTKAEGLLAKLKGGADFAALAKESSDCPSKGQGGDLGLFPRGQMVKAFEDVTFTLKPGEMSGLVESEFGFHVIRLEAMTPASVAPTARPPRASASTSRDRRSTP